MNKILATLAITAISAAAFAGVTFEGRYDYASDTLNSTETSNSTGMSGFLWNTAKMGFTGKASDSVSFKARLNLIAGQNLHINGKDNSAAVGANTVVNSNGTTAANNALAAGDLVEYAMATHKISDSLTSMCGKLDNALVSGFEGQERGQDMYFTSAGYLTTATRVTGVAFNYEIMTGRNLVFEIFNGTNSYAKDNSRTGMGLVYLGTYGDVGAIASYHVDPQGISGTKDLNNTYITVGLSYKMSAWKFMFDYDMDTFGNQANSGGDKTSNSMVLQVKYDMGNGWTPYFKAESTSKVGFNYTNKIPKSDLSGFAADSVGTKDGTDAITNFAIAGDYKASEGFMYHIAYVSKSTAYDSLHAFKTLTGAAGNNTVAETLAYAGITYTADFMK